MTSLFLWLLLTGLISTLNCFLPLCLSIHASLKNRPCSLSKGSTVGVEGMRVTSDRLARLFKFSMCRLFLLVSITKRCVIKYKQYFCLFPFLLPLVFAFSNMDLYVGEHGSSRLLCLCWFDSHLEIYQFFLVTFLFSTPPVPAIHATVSVLPSTQGVLSVF